MLKIVEQSETMRFQVLVNMKTLFVHGFIEWSVFSESVLWKSVPDDPCDPCNLSFRAGFMIGQ